MKGESSATRPTEGRLPLPAQWMFLGLKPQMCVNSIRLYVLVFAPHFIWEAQVISMIYVFYGYSSSIYEDYIIYRIRIRISLSVCYLKCVSFGLILEEHLIWL